MVFTQKVSLSSPHLYALILTLALMFGKKSVKILYLFD